MLEKYIIKKNTRFEKIVKKLNTNIKKILIVIDKENKVCGTITDGDIRRSIKKKKIIKVAWSLCNKKPILFNDHIKKISLKIQKKIKYGIFVNNQKRLVKIIDFVEKPNLIVDNNDTAICIMAGGKGKRLMPLTKSVPKPLLKINELTILERLIHQINLFKFKNILISTNYLHQHFQKEIKYLNSKFSLNIKIIKEQKFLGTAGSLKKIRANLFKNVIVCNSDLITDLDFNKFLKEHKKNSEITIFTNNINSQIPYGCLKTKNKMVINLKEKPIIKNTIALGIYAISSSIIKLIKINEKIDMPELILRSLKKSKKVNIYPNTGYCYDLGKKETLIEFDKKYKKFF
jgi:dTDP-glucose pyrophosphorylase